MQVTLFCASHLVASFVLAIICAEHYTEVVCCAAPHSGETWSHTWTKPLDRSLGPGAPAEALHVIRSAPQQRLNGETQWRESQTTSRRRHVFLSFFLEGKTVVGHVVCFPSKCWLRAVVVGESLRDCKLDVN